MRERRARRRGTTSSRPEAAASISGRQRCALHCHAQDSIGSRTSPSSRTGRRHRAGRAVAPDAVARGLCAECGLGLRGRSQGAPPTVLRGAAHLQDMERGGWWGRHWRCLCRRGSVCHSCRPRHHGRRAASLRAAGAYTEIVAAAGAYDAACRPLAERGKRRSDGTVERRCPTSPRRCAVHGCGQARRGH